MFLKSCVRGCVRLRGICLPIHLSPNSFVSQVLCQGLCPPPGDLSPNSFVRLVSGAVSASGRFVSQFICLPIHLSPRSLSPNSFVSQFICLPGPVSGAVSAFGGFVSQFVCLPSFPKQFTVGVLSSFLRGVRPCVTGRVRLSGSCLCLVSLHLSPFMSLPEWWCPPLWVLSVPCLCLVSLHLSPFMCLPEWWCPPLWVLSVPCLPSFVSLHVSP